MNKMYTSKNAGVFREYINSICKSSTHTHPSSPNNQEMDFGVRGVHAFRETGPT